MFILLLNNDYCFPILVKVLYEEILVEAPLAHFFLSKILRKKRVGMSVLTDLKV